MLTIALSKGRLAEQAINRFAAIGMDCQNIIEKNSRKLIFKNPNQNVRFFLAKPSDVPTYVEYGAADMGVAGKDTLLEEDRDLYEVYDFGFGKCMLSVCGLPGTPRKNGLRVATKYPAIAAKHFESLGITIELIKLSGSIELAPIVGLSDVIVDIVETGSTLKENGLVVLDDIAESTTRLIVNRVSMKLEYERVNDIIRKLKGESPC